MGGNIFSNLSRRYSKEEYLRIESELEERFNSFFQAKVFYRIPFYSEKGSFGDLDFVLDLNAIPKKILRNDWKKFIAQELNIVHSSSNGNVFSFLYEHLQIDAIAIGCSEEVEPAVRYFAYNDLSNLLGRLAHKIGMKISHKGSFLVIRDPETANTSLIKEHLVTREYFDALAMLGLSKERYLSGFSSKEDLFRFVASSSFFQKDIYLLHNRSHRSRIRDRKRQIYHDFLEWIERENPLDRHSFSEVREHGGHGIREPYFSEVIVPFVYSTQNGRDIKEEVSTILSENEVEKRFRKQFFNGDLIREKTGKEGKELGKLIGELRQRRAFPHTIEQKKQFMRTFADDPKQGLHYLLMIL